eukprot:scaffold14380_cov47-Phaeocystis_antarctica.AAC.2
MQRLRLSPHISLDLGHKCMRLQPGCIGLQPKCIGLQGLAFAPTCSMTRSAESKAAVCASPRSRPSTSFSAASSARSSSIASACCRACRST